MIERAAAFARGCLNLVLGRPATPILFAGATLGPDDVSIVKEALRDPASWVEGDAVAEYERAFAAYLGTASAFSFSAGREAFSALLEAFGIGEGDEVVLPGYTCVVVPNALRYRGIVPRYVDIELETYGPDVSRVEAALTGRTRAILIHHLYGLVCRDYEALLALGRARGIPVIEDCAQSLGARFRGTPVGRLGDGAFFSSEQSKVICTGMGGIATAADPAVAARLADVQRKTPWPKPDTVHRRLVQLRRLYLDSHPRWQWAYRTFSPEGRAVARRDASVWLESTASAELQGPRPSDYGRRLPNALARIGLNQLAKLDGLNALRQKAAAHWRAWAEREGYAAPLELPESEPIYLRFPVRVPPAMKQDLSWGVELGAEIGAWFLTQTHPLCAGDPVLKDLPKAREAVACCVNLPCSPRNLPDNGGTQP